MYASVGKRFIASMIDGLIFLFFFFILGFVISTLSIVDGSSSQDLIFLMAQNIFLSMVVNLLSYVFYWLYYALFESSSYQATPGKMLWGLKVTDMSGNRITFLRATGRFWSKIVSSMTLCIGYIMAIFTEKKQALHDMMAGTLVMEEGYTGAPMPNQAETDLIQDLHNGKFKTYDEFLSKKIELGLSAEKSGVRSPNKGFIKLLTVIICIVSIAFLFFNFQGGMNFNNIALKTTKIINTNDSKFKISFPPGWTTTGSIQNNSILKLRGDLCLVASKKNPPAYLCVIKEPKQPGSNLDTLTNSIYQALSRSKMTLSNVPVYTINNYDARQFTLDGVANTNLTYTVTTIDTPNSYYELMSWCKQSDYTLNHDEFTNIIESFELVE